MEETMRTIQEYLKEIDHEQLINAYLYVYPINFARISNEKLKIKEVKHLVKEKLHEYIQRLQLLEVEASKDGKNYVLFVHKMYKDGYADEAYSLVCLQELLEKGDQAETYAYEFTKQAEIMGFLVSDADYTQKHIEGLLIDVLYEASFFGYEQQDLDKEIRSLEAAIENIKEGKEKFYMFDELQKEINLKEEKDDMADQLMHQVINAVYEYDQYCKKNEIRVLLESVLKEKVVTEKN